MTPAEQAIQLTAIQLTDHDRLDALETKVAEMEGCFAFERSERQALQTILLSCAQEQRAEVETLDLKSEYLVKRLEEISANDGGGLLKEVLGGILELLRMGGHTALATSKAIVAFDQRLQVLEAGSRSNDT